MNTAFLLMAQYDAQVIIPVATVCRDYFPHLTPQQFLRKINAGELALPLVRMDVDSQKGAKGVHLPDLAAHIDQRAEAARRECCQLTT